MGARIWLRRARDPVGVRDGQRVLVDALWPRGVRRDALALDAWLRDLGPSSDLRRWFGHRAERFAQFRARYLVELRAPAASAALDALRGRLARGRVTLVFDARARRCNQAVVLRGLLEGAYRFAADCGNSPPCEADLAGRSEPLASRAELLAACTELLAAERAGARVTWRMRDEARAEGASRLAELLAGAHDDETASCRLLVDAIRYLGGAPGAAVGDFEGRVLALPDRHARMTLLVRGQGWVARRLTQLLPGVGDPVLEALLQDMLARHHQGIDAVNGWLDGAAP